MKPQKPSSPGNKLVRDQIWKTKSHRIKTKALSTNDMHVGRHFPTPEFKAFKQEMEYLLPKRVDVPEGKLHISYRFGVSSKNCDYDNLIKATQDAISRKYGFNDRMIYFATIEKVDIPTGEEFIEFSIGEYLP